MTEPVNGIPERRELHFTDARRQTGLNNSLLGARQFDARFHHALSKRLLEIRARITYAFEIFVQRKAVRFDPLGLAGSKCGQLTRYLVIEAEKNAQRFEDVQDGRRGGFRRFP